MIVVDASAVTELLLQTDLGTRVERRLYRDDDDLHAPHRLDAEVLSALRRLVHAGEVLAERAEEAIDDLGLLRIIRHGHLDLGTRAWELRENFTAHDAVHVALDELEWGLMAPWPAWSKNKVMAVAIRIDIRPNWHAPAISSAQSRTFQPTHEPLQALPKHLRDAIARHMAAVPLSR